MVVILVLLLIFRFAPRYGQTHMLVYIGVCSLMGSLTVWFSTITKLYIKKISSFRSDAVFFNLIGYEREGIGYCLKAIIFGNESIYICPDLVFHRCGGHLWSHSNTLLKQGNRKVWELLILILEFFGVKFFFFFFYLQKMRHNLLITCLMHLLQLSWLRPNSPWKKDSCTKWARSILLL